MILKSLNLKYVLSLLVTASTSQLQIDILKLVAYALILGEICSLFAVRTLPVSVEGYHFTNYYIQALLK